MVKLNVIYTRTGDKGETGLGDGSRRSKSDARVAAMGEVDEANCAIGLAVLAVRNAGDAADLAIEPVLMRIQNDLFDLGADLCRPESPAAKGPVLRVIETQVSRLEREIDGMNAKLKPLNSFVLPGGSAAAAHLHLARTIVRRAERDTTLLAAKENINPVAIKYINRLSDHLFVLARRLNDNGATDVLWVPGGNR